MKSQQKSILNALLMAKDIRMVSGSKVIEDQAKLESFYQALGKAIDIIKDECNDGYHKDFLGIR